MSDYAFVHRGTAYTPNQTKVDASHVDDHNAAIEAREMEYWQTQPYRMLAYYHFNIPGVRLYREVFRPSIDGAKVTTWTGQLLGYISSAHVYRHNFGGRFISLRVVGTNGATYYGRASYDWGSCINLRKVV